MQVNVLGQVPASRPRQKNYTSTKGDGTRLVGDWWKLRGKDDGWRERDGVGQRLVDNG